MELGAKAMEAMNAMKLSKVEAAQVLLTSAVEFGFGTGTALAMVLGAKELCRAAAHKRRFKARKWEKRAEASGREESRMDGMFVTQPFARAEMPEELKGSEVEKLKGSADLEDAGLATVEPSSSEACDPLEGVEFAR